MVQRLPRCLKHLKAAQLPGGRPWRMGPKWRQSRASCGAASPILQCRRSRGAELRDKVRPLRRRRNIWPAEDDLWLLWCSAFGRQMGSCCCCCLAAARLLLFLLLSRLGAQKGGLLPARSNNQDKLKSRLSLIFAYFPPFFPRVSFWKLLATFANFCQLSARCERAPLGSLRRTVQSGRFGFLLDKRKVGKFTLNLAHPIELARHPPVSLARLSLAGLCSLARALEWAADCGWHPKSSAPTKLGNIESLICAGDSAPLARSLITH